MLHKLLLVALMATLTMAQVDQTLEEKAKGEDVVEAVVNKIHASHIFPDDYDFLTRVAYVESKFGEDANTYRNNYFGGIWQIAETVYKKTLDAITLKEKHDKIYASFNINWATGTKWNDLLKPFHSGLAARLFLATLEASGKPIPQTVEAQAKYWDENYNRHDNMGAVNFTDAVKDLENKTAPCKGKMDLVALLDGSGSVTEGPFQKSLEFVADLFSSYSSDNVRKGFIQFGDDAHEVFDLDNTLTDAEMRSTVLNTKYLKQGTNTNSGILLSVKMYEKAAGRAGVPKVLTVFTDGESNAGGDNGKGGVPAVRDAKNADIITFSIGIGANLKQSELLEIAYGDQSHVFNLQDFDALTEFFRRLNSETCSVPQKPQVNETTSDTLAHNEKRYYDFTIPEEGLTVVLDAYEGEVEGYYSYFLKTPSSAMNDGVLSGEETFIPNKYGTTSSVFLAIKGLGASNNYTILSQEGYQVQPTSPTEEPTTTPFTTEDSTSESTTEEPEPEKTSPTTTEEPTSTDSAVTNNLHLIPVFLSIFLFSLQNLV